MKLSPVGIFWVLYFLLLLVALPTLSLADEAASTSASGSIAGSASQSGSIGYIDNSNRVAEAADFGDRAPGVFAAGVTAGGSNPCVVSVGAGLSVPGGGANFASAHNDMDCTVRESLRLFAAITHPAEGTNQVLLREIACQSVVYWDAFYRVFEETSDPDYFCSNDRPEKKILTYRRDYISGIPEPDKYEKTVTSANTSNGFF